MAMYTLQSMSHMSNLLNFVSAQTEVLLQTPSLLNALLTISLARNWLQPTLAVMRLHACLAQAVDPNDQMSKFAQMPSLNNEEIKALLKTCTTKGQEIGFF